MLSGLVAVVAFFPLVIDISHDAHYIVLTILLLTVLLTRSSEVAEKSLVSIRIMSDFADEWILLKYCLPVQSICGRVDHSRFAEIAEPILKITYHLTRFSL